MSLQTEDFTTLVRNQVAAIQAKAKNLINFAVGSVLRAIVESNAAVVLWLQSLILQVLSLTRAATSTGTDLDSFVNDYGVTRLGAVAATGSVTFSRFTATQQAVIAVGAQAQTTDGTQVFAVYEDATNAAWDPVQNAYVVAAGTTSVTVPVQANTPGSGGNVTAGAINTLATSIPGIDSVTNAAAFTNGIDAESDSALRTRFVAYLSSLSKATKIAIGNAVLGVQPGLAYTLVENQDYSGTLDNGYFYVVVDDGSGNPPASLISSVSNAVDAARPVGTRFGVYGPVTITAGVVLSITTAAGYTHSDMVTAVQKAITAYINGLALGATLYYTKIADVAYGVSPGITAVTAGYTINGSNADISATAKQVIRAGTITIS